MFPSTQPKLTTEQALTPGPTISSLPHHFSPDQNEPVSEESPEPLLRQEAVSASPTLTTIHLQLSRQALPTTAASAYTTHESTAEEPHSTAAKVTPVREVPMERKTVASEVSQDLDELGRAVMQIKSDVILNQRILLVTVAVAGTAMLGVLIMAVHECSSRRQALTSKKKDVAKDDDHVTKVNLEEAW
ncbi:uncharacterized protein [Panulirus ornatus]|uniref:uncharacterized protein n=1 Tax=Panulirus ornatus TaxID=150431 RepID=UPI003A85599E